jgi:ABC-type Fe3+-hydroxamate transport system substrate-binding protein
MRHVKHGKMRSERITVNNASEAKVDDLVDAFGNVHQAINTTNETRIVSLVPSITELLCDMGLAPFLVGRTGFCIHPKEVLKNIPKIGGTKDVNIEKIRRLAPSHLIVNIDENEKQTVALLAEFIPNIIVTHPIEPRDNLAMFRLIGSIFRVESAAENFCQQFEQAYQRLQSQTVATNGKKVLYCIWKDPWMTVSRDTYIANLLGLRACTIWESSSSPNRYPIFDWHDPTLAEVEVVMLSTEPYRFTTKHVDALQEELGKPVILVDGEMLSWYGSRAIHGLDYLAQLRF